MPHNLTLSLDELRCALADGSCTARGLVEASLTRITAVNDPEHPVFLAVYAEQALARAEQMDAARAAGDPLPPFAGIPFAVKDLFDVAGEVTTAGSKILRDAPPAQQNAAVVQRLIDAGMILIGKTNMSEFAFTGLGLNPHHGTPPAWGTSGDTACAPGGSSSGAGVSIAAGMVPVSLGTDTAGSCRIPAAWNGVIGYKPTQHSVPGDGAFPLSPLLDVPGPFTRRVACCHQVYQLMAGAQPSPLTPKDINTLKLAVPTGIAMSKLEPQVEEAFKRTITTLKAAGASIEEIEVPEFELAGEIFSTAPLAAYDAWQLHRERLSTSRELFDPFVAMRVTGGQNISSDIQNANIAKREKAIASYHQRIASYDALIMPTTATAAPPLAPLQYDMELFAKTNGLALRNTALSNFVDGCAISLPCHNADEPALGFSLCHAKDKDQKLFETALAVERALH